MGIRGSLAEQYMQVLVKKTRTFCIWPDENLSSSDRSVSEEVPMGIAAPGQAILYESSSKKTGFLYLMGKI